MASVGLKGRLELLGTLMAYNLITTPKKGNGAES